MESHGMSHSIGTHGMSHSIGTHGMSHSMGTHGMSHRSRNSGSLACPLGCGIFMTVIGGIMLPVSVFSLSLPIYFTLIPTGWALLVGLSCLLIALCRYRMAKLADNRITAATVSSISAGNMTTGTAPQAAVTVFQNQHVTSYGFQQRQQFTNRPYPTQFPNSQSTYPTQVPPYSPYSTYAIPKEDDALPSYAEAVAS